MRALAAILLGALALAACAGQAGPEGGVASYDALKKAKDDCTAKGGTFVLRSGDPTWIGNYACERK